MALPDLALGPEWALLELLVIGLEDPDAETLFVETDSVERTCIGVKLFIRPCAMAWSLNWRLF